MWKRRAHLKALPLDSSIVLMLNNQGIVVYHKYKHIPVERNKKFRNRTLDGKSIFTKKVVLKWGNEFFPKKDVETTSNQI